MSNFFVMAWLLSLGFVPNSSLETNGGSINASDYLVQTLGAGFYLADCVHVYTTVEIQDTKSQGIYFDPFRCDFLIGGSLYYKYFSIGISHECNHDIVTNMDLNKYNGWEAGFNQAYINCTVPFHIVSGITITPSITLTDQFGEKVRIKTNDEKKYFNYNGLNISPNIFSFKFRLETELFFLRPRLMFQAGFLTYNH